MNLPDPAAFRAGEPSCPSDFTLDQLHLGHLPEAERRAVEDHAHGCTECAARLAERVAGFAGFPETDERAILARLQVERAALAERPAARLRAWWLSLFAVAIAGAAAAFLMIRATPPAGPGQDELAPEITRTKGQVTLRVHRERAGQVAEAQSGDTFHEGDRLMFEVDVKAEGHLRIFGVEPSGAVYQAWPLPQQAAEGRRGVGPAQRLPGAVALDATQGREVLHAVLCPLTEGPPTCVATGDAEGGLRCPEGCAQGRFVLVKQ